MAIDWYGDKIKAKMQRAMIVGVNQTMGAAVTYAKQNHPFTNRTTTAEKAIRIVKSAAASIGMITGLWGAANSEYFEHLEFGTKKTTSRTSIAQRTRIMATGVLKRPKNAGAPPWKGGSFAPTLRPAAAQIYPLLAGKIKEAFARG